MGFQKKITIDMKDFEEIYRKKIISIEEAVAHIKSDTDLIVAQCASEPQG